MIIMFTVVRLVLVTVGIPRTRIRLFQAPISAKSPVPPVDSVTLGNRSTNP